MPTVEIRDLTVRYGTKTAIENLSTCLNVGVVGLLGPNGAGKSSLMRVLATVQQPSSGEICWLGGHDHIRSTAEVRRTLGYLPQHVSLYPNYTVERFVRHIALLKRLPKSTLKDEVERVLRATDMTELRRKKCKTLSGGMRQRLGVACAILGNPAVLLLDEPTTGLDPAQRLLFREMIAEVGQSSVVLLSTHLTEDVASLCRDVIVLSDGVAVFHGRVRDLISLADGRVWLSETRSPTARAAWMTGEGLWRNVGDPPSGAQLVSATLDDGYILVDGSSGMRSTSGLGVPDLSP